MESPLRLTAHGGFGEGDGETRRSKGRKVRPVPTLRSSGGGRETPADYTFSLGRIFSIQSFKISIYSFTCPLANRSSFVNKSRNIGSRST
jgi:hypothetical protein